MSDLALTPTSYLVLGIVADVGEATPYVLKQRVALSVGNFWSFPHSQLYAEPARLAAAGLLEERQEDGGRRRKQYRLTGAGRQALDAWLAEPVAERAEMRDTALLQLFFCNDPDRAAAIAATQVDLHRRQIEVYRQTKADVADVATPSQLATLDMGFRYEQAAVDFWQSVVDDPPASA